MIIVAECFIVMHTTAGFEDEAFAHFFRNIDNKLPQAVHQPVWRRRSPYISMSMKQTNMLIFILVDSC